jgi:GAF domain-containing protein
MLTDEAEHLEFQRLQALRGTRLLTASTPPELEEICQRVKEHFRVAVALVTLIDKDVLIAKAQAGTDLEEVPRVGQFCDYTIRSDDVFVVPDASRDERFASNPVVTGEPFIRFYAGAPPVYMRQLRLGALCLLDPRPREFTLGDKAELALMADEVVSVIVEREFSDRCCHVWMAPFCKH